jgi:hypothetical protein
MAEKDCDPGTRVPMQERRNMNRLSVASAVVISLVLEAVAPVLIILVLITSALITSALITPVQAAPPTVTPSPGYDARLQESRKGATAGSVTVVDPATPPAPVPPPRHHGKRKQ